MKRRRFLQGLAAVVALPQLAWARIDPLVAPTALTPTLTEAHLQRIIEKCWTKGGDPDVILCAPWQKQVISGFTGKMSGFQMPPGGGLVEAVSVYLSDFGEARVVDDAEEADRTGWETLDIRRFQG